MKISALSMTFTYDRGAVTKYSSTNPWAGVFFPKSIGRLFLKLKQVEERKSVWAEAEIWVNAGGNFWRLGLSAFGQMLLD